MPVGTVTVAAAVESVRLPNTWVTGALKVWSASVPVAAVAFALKVTWVPEFTWVMIEPEATFMAPPARLMPTPKPGTPA